MQKVDDDSDGGHDQDDMMICEYVGHTENGMLM